MKKIVVVGSLNMDMVIHTPYYPKSGETILGSGFMTNCGGKGANQATAAGKLGGNVIMCGKVGSDVFGAKMKENLGTYGVNTQLVTETDGASGIAVIVVVDGENRIIIDSGANATMTEKDIDAALDRAERGDIYLTQLENPINVIGYGLRKAKEKGLFTILNPAPASTKILEHVRYADLVIPNETELEILGGKESLFNAGVRTVITTLGGNGYEIATRESLKRYPCIRVKAVDTTAAGDTLCGGLAAGLARGEELVEAMAFASKAASIACTRMGAAQSVPTYEEVMQYES